MPAPPPPPHLETTGPSHCTAALCLCTGNSTNWGEEGGTRGWLWVLTLLLTIILSRSLLMSANTGLLSGSCFQHCSIRLYLVGQTGG